MALLYCDSFDHYTSLGNKWESVFGGSITGGRHGNGVQLTTGVSSPQITKTFTTSSKVTVGFALRYDSIPSNNFFLTLQDFAGAAQVELRVTGAGQFVVSRNSTALATSEAILLVDVWYYVEFEVTISDTGSFVIRVNGVPLTWTSGDGTGDTKNSANASVSRLRFIGTPTAAGGSFLLDDLYLLNDTDSGVAGIPNDDFLGDVRVQAVFPNGNGNTSQLTGSDGNSTDNYLLVDEAAPNSDTDYVESATVGEKDTYAFGNLTPTTGTTFGVQVNPFVRKTDAGARSVESVARHSGTEVDSAAVPLSTTYQYLSDIREAKPGGGAWSISDVNGAEFGAKVA